MTDLERFALRDQLIRHEGLRLTVYKDSLGIETIGVGRNLRGKGLSKTEAHYLLSNDIDECLADLQTFGWFADLAPTRQRALLDFRFNVGPKTFRDFKRMIAALARHDYEAAATSLKESKWFTQVQEARSSCLIRQIREGV